MLFIFMHSCTEKPLDLLLKEISKNILMNRKMESCNKIVSELFNNHEVNGLLLKLHLEKFKNDQAKAEETMRIMELVLNDEKIQSVRSLISSLNFIGTIIQSQIPWDTTPFNIVQRIIKIVKEETNALKTAAADSNPPLISQPRSSDSFSSLGKDVDFSVLKSNIIEAVAEQKAELEQCEELIAMQGEAKIHSDEIIMTCGYSDTVLGFLFKASKKRRFHVIVAECLPLCHGHKMAKLLSSSNIQTTVIQDSAIFSMMSRVNKVIIGCMTVFCNGGIKTFLGAASLAYAAKFYSVPFYVCTPTFKFSMEMMEEVKEFGSSASVIPKGSEKLLNEVNVSVAKFDYVPPENVTSFITNNRGIAPSYVYRQVMELYQPSTDDI